jgi:predicted acylesterase/phospholipase RssA
MLPQRRLALTISGAVSLGAFEGGALAALIVAIQGDQGSDAPRVVVDTIAGASAGSITGVLAAFCLLQGADPVEVMLEAWVRSPQIERLRAHDASAPLTMDVMGRVAHRIFASSTVCYKQTAPVHVSMALAPLRGLQYTLDFGRTKLEASSFLEWRTFVYDSSTPWGDEARMQSDIDTALASGSHSAGFPPALLPVPNQPAGEIGNLPVGASGMWYTDGGTVQNEPLGQAINIAAGLDGNDTSVFERLFLLIHPQPSGGYLSTQLDWSYRSGGARPSWDHTLGRALGIHMTQSLYEDMLRMVKVNQRLADIEASAQRFVRALPDAQVESTLCALEEVAYGPPVSGAGQTHPVDRASRVLRHLAGLADKNPISLEVVSPSHLANRKGVKVEDLLAGEFLAHFGGFLDVRFRISDFWLGYVCMLE